MNKLFKYIIFTMLFICAGCSTQSIKIGHEPKSNKESRSIFSQSDNVVAAKSLWIIKGGLKGEAGLYTGTKAADIKSLSLDISIVEFLASVKVALTYSQVQSEKELAFRYPAFIGLLARDFQMKIGDRKFRAVISGKESAEEIYQLAKSRGFNAVVVSQKAFGEMIVNASLKEKSDIEILFSYTQLSSLLGKERVLAFPKFHGLENADFKIDISGRFLSTLVSLTGLKKKVKGNKFFENITDKEVIKDGLLIKYELRSLHAISSDKKKMIKWNSNTNSYYSLPVGNVEMYSLCKAEIIKPAFSYLRLKEMVSQDKSFKEIEEHTIKSKLLTPISRLLLIDTSR